MRIFLIFITSLLFANSVENYKPINSCVEFRNSSYIAIRSFDFNKNRALLIVDANSLNTGLVYKNDTNTTACPSDINSSKYKVLTRFNESSKHPLQNDGIVSSGQGMVITTDLCPSSKEGFEDRLYKAVIAKFKNPVPITLFITKRWINKHKKEFEELKQWQKEGKLKITWGNHTALHIYHPKVPLKENFVLSKEENLTKDILDLEQTLIENGATPSVFFRFPGLVSDKNTTEVVSNLGLITIGSNSWLAKGEKIKSGSIILMHGNKNEPKGVDIFLKILDSNASLPKIESIRAIAPKERLEP